MPSILNPFLQPGRYPWSGKLSDRQILSEKRCDLFEMRNFQSGWSIMNPESVLNDTLNG